MFDIVSLAVGVLIGMALMVIISPRVDKDTVKPGVQLTEGKGLKISAPDWLLNLRVYNIIAVTALVLIVPSVVPNVVRGWNLVVWTAVIMVAYWLIDRLALFPTSPTLRRWLKTEQAQPEKPTKVVVKDKPEGEDGGNVVDGDFTVV